MLASLSRPYLFNSFLPLRLCCNEEVKQTRGDNIQRLPLEACFHAAVNGEISLISMKAHRCDGGQEGGRCCLCSTIFGLNPGWRTRVTKLIHCVVTAADEQLRARLKNWRSLRDEQGWSPGPASNTVFIWTVFQRGTGEEPISSPLVWTVTFLWPSWTMCSCSDNTCDSRTPNSGSDHQLTARGLNPAHQTVQCGPQLYQIIILENCVFIGDLWTFRTMYNPGTCNKERFLFVFLCIYIISHCDIIVLQEKKSPQWVESFSAVFSRSDS